MMNNNILVPYVIERTSEGERSYDLYSRLLKDRIVMITGEVTQESMSVAMAEILFLNNEDKTKPISLYINSPGGSVIDGLGALIDTMNFVSAPIYTIVAGMAASMGAVILSAGEKGHRYAMPSAQILVHPMSGGTSGRTNDNIIATRYEQRLQNYLLNILGHNCGQISDKSYIEIRNAIEGLRDIDEDSIMAISKKAKAELTKFKKTCDYDHWMFPEEALQYGIIDKVLTKEDEIL